MLKTMRNSFHHLKWTLFAVIAVFILGFVFWSGSGTSGDVNGQIVAQVGHERITAVDFDRQYKAQVERYRQMYQGNFSPELERALDLPRNVLDSMIEHILRLEAAKRYDLRVSDDELAKKIVTLPFFQDNGQFIGREKYEKMLRANGVAPEKFEEDLREDMLLQKYGNLIKASVLVPEADLLREYAARNDKATIEYILVPTSRLETNAQPTDADLQAYLDKHKDRYRAPLQRRTKYLLLETAKLRGKIKPTDAEIQAEYAATKDSLNVPEQVHVAHILIATKPDAGPEADAQARAKAEMVAARAKQPGADFAKLANEYTDDPSGKGSGGELPPFARGPDGARVRGGRVRDVAGRGSRPRQVAVRLPRHQVRVEDAGAHAHPRGGAALDRGRARGAAGVRGGRPPVRRAGREGQGAARMPRTTRCASCRATSSPSTRPSGPRRATRSPASEPTRSSPTRPGRCRSARSRRRRSPPSAASCS